MSSDTAPTAPPILPSTGGCSPLLPTSEDDKPQPASLTGGAGPVSTPTVASNTDAVTEEVELPKPQQPAVATILPVSTDNKPSPNVAKKTQSDLKGSIAVSVVASSHASLNEALKRLRTEFENIRSSGVACEKALSTIDSLLIESESVLRELISRSQGGDSEGAKKRRANAKRSGRRAGQKKEEGNKAPGPAEEGIAGVPKEQNSSASPRRSGGIARNKRGMPLNGIFTNDRPVLRGPAAPFQSPTARPPVPFRIDETVMQYRSPEFYRLIGDRFVAPGPRKPRPPFGREREVVKKSRLAARAREEAALRDELRKATTAAEYTALMEKANKMGMQFEVAAVNARLEKLARQAEQPAAS
eukprot:Protomagalhaensia_wolfi_Nauph_80__592@NODE_1337_length_1578_cov_52_055231_g1033_i0_p1_GENE_NODE_1337_length_1578_cov_52_055231_g1033_i0NODE_1337_length_1578_cov_52_055231_g1033_i0_p1_ORF_typecomplete_len358_score56_92Lectin_N/PF03954_14/0_0035Lectin_N/PF03954_14/1_3e03_NODE_1337_length_1578_cov_52_055231_g1033_i02631336